MSFDLSSITSAKRDRPYRLLVTGPHKTGKSTFAAGFPSPIFLPIKGEEGIDDFDVPTFPVVSKFAELMEAFGSLCGEHGFQTIIIDSVSTLEPIVWDETRRINLGVDSIEKVGGGFGKGYTEALKQWREITGALDYLRDERGMTPILIGHVKAEKFNDPMVDSYDRYNLDLHKHAAAMLQRWADGTLFVNRRTIVKKEDLGFKKTASRAVEAGNGVPFLYTQSRPAHPGGGRTAAWAGLPYELPLDYKAFEEALAKARA